MFTTSRYASKDTRALARRMASESREPYVARGKKTIEELSALARRSGEAEVRLVTESGGAAASISLISVDETGGWAWKEERLLNSTEKGRAVSGRSADES